MLPVLDVAVVQSLAVDLRSTLEALNFLDRFDALLSARLQNIHDALMVQDLEQMKIAMLSLHTSAAMVGAAQLPDCTGRIRNQLSGWPFRPAAAWALMKDLAKEAIAFTRAYRLLRSQRTLNDASNWPQQATEQRPQPRPPQ